LPTVAGERIYDGSPSLEETIENVSGFNFWIDDEDGLDTRKTIERIKRNRIWKSESESAEEELSGKITGSTCGVCGEILISDGKCLKCPKCKTGDGCGGG